MSRPIPIPKPKPIVIDKDKIPDGLKPPVLTRQTGSSRYPDRCLHELKDKYDRSIFVWSECNCLECCQFRLGAVNTGVRDNPR